MVECRIKAYHLMLSYDFWQFIHLKFCDVFFIQFSDVDKHFFWILLHVQKAEGISPNNSPIRIKKACLRMSEIDLKEHRILEDHIKMRCFIRATCNIQWQDFSFYSVSTLIWRDLPCEYMKQYLKKKCLSTSKNGIKKNIAKFKKCRS